MVGDCRMITMSKLLEKRGLQLSPAMCFGLGQGYDFVYWIEKSVKVPMIVITGRSQSCDSMLFENLGILSREITPDSDLDTLTDNGLNLIVNVDRYYLDYLSEKFGRTHFGMHELLISKGNMEKFTCFDALDEHVTEISKVVLEQARFSDIKPFAPEGKGFYIEDAYDVNVTGKLVEQCIKCNMHKYQNEKEHGLIRFESFIHQMEIFLSMVSGGKQAAYFNVQMEFLCKYIREFETTQSFYRNVYAAFLSEAAEKYSLSLDADIARCRQLGDTWNDLGVQMVRMKKDNGNMKDKVQFFIMRLKEIYEKEQLFARKLSGNLITI